MRYALRAVNENSDVVLFRRGDNFRQRIYRTQRVRDMSYAKKFYLLSHHGKKSIELDFAAVVDGRNDQLRAGLFTNQLPGHDIRMVFQP